MSVMKLSAIDARNPIVLAVWREYHAARRVADEARAEIADWPAKRERLDVAIGESGAVMRECLDMLSQCGEDVSRVPDVAAVA